MQRRKLSLYTLMFAAGITTGFFIFDRSRAAEAVLFAISVFVFIVLADVSGPAADFRSSLAAAFAAGLILFAMRSCMYTAQADHVLNTASQHNSLIASQKTNAGSVNSEETDFSINGENYISKEEETTEEQHKITGRVISSTIKKGKLTLIIKKDGKGPDKVVISTREIPDDPLFTEGMSKGSVIKAVGSYKELEPADDPGCFDYRLYMKSKGVSVGFKAVSIEVTDEGNGLLLRIRHHLYEVREDFISSFDNDTAGFIRGIIFGDKSEIDEEILDEFNSNSTGHILAVSGLHIGFLYTLLRALTRKKKTAGASVLIIAVILIYGEMTLWSAATVRACIVMSVSLLSLHLRRPFDLLTSVSFAAFLILIREPYQLFNTGFQMSFLAMGGIAFLVKPVSMVTGEALGVMLSVQAGTLPVTAYTFCRINPLAVFINVPVILLSSVLVPLCMMMLMLSLTTGLIPHAGIKLAELIVYAVTGVNRLLGLGGSFSLKVAGFGAAWTVAAYLVMFGLSSEWLRVMLLRHDFKRIAKQTVLFLLPVLVLGSCLYDSFSDDEVVFVAVGQGDCTHIRAGGHNILIDGGGVSGFNSSETRDGTGTDKNEDDSFNVGEKILMPYLLHSGVDRIDTALVTHLHADHYKGIAELAEIYPVGALGIPADYRGSLNEDPEASKFNNQVTSNETGGASSSETALFDQNKIIYIKPDSKVILDDDVYVDVIWPVEVSDDPVAADDPNEHNTVYMIHYRDIKIMVTGDLLEEDELKMVEYYEGTDILKCDILKVAHHGSKSSSSEEFLNAASPRIAVIQVGRNNFYGHPHAQTLGRLEARGIKTFRTDLNGAVGIDIRKERLNVDLYR